MNLLQKIYNSLEKKVNEALMKRKLNAFVETETIDNEERKEKTLALIRANIGDRDFYCAYHNYKAIKKYDRDNELLKEFKNFLLSEQKDDN